MTYPPGSAAPPNAIEWSHMTSAERSDYERAVLDRESKGGQSFVHTRDDRGNVVIADRATGKVVERRT
jgi:hypothetical protein